MSGSSRFDEENPDMARKSSRSLRTDWDATDLKSISIIPKIMLIISMLANTTGVFGGRSMNAGSFR